MIFPGMVSHTDLDHLISSLAWHALLGGRRRRQGSWRVKRGGELRDGLEGEAVGVVGGGQGRV